MRLGIGGGLFLAALLGNAPSVLLAQADITVRLVQELKDRLGLSDDQAAKVEALVRKREEKRKVARQSDDPAEARQEWRERMREFQAGVEALLTDEQKIKYEALRAEQRERMRQGRQGGGEPASPSPSPSPTPKT